MHLPAQDVQKPVITIRALIKFGAGDEPHPTMSSNPPQGPLVAPGAGSLFLDFSHGIIPWQDKFN
jgi:hypothetical protein